MLPVRGWLHTVRVATGIQSAFGRCSPEGIAAAIATAVARITVLNQAPRAHSMATMAGMSNPIRPTAITPAVAFGSVGNDWVAINSVGPTARDPVTVAVVRRESRR